MTDQANDVREVSIKINDSNGYDFDVVNVKLNWDERNEPVMTRGCENETFFYVHQWSRQDGKIDSYKDCLAEAKVNGHNPQYSQEKSKAQELVQNMPRKIDDATKKPKLRQTV